MITHGFNWDANPEMGEKLATMWNGGASSAVIAQTLGNGITRCAVIGKAHRLKLPPRTKRAVVIVKKPAPKKPVEVAAAPPPPVPLLPPETFPDKGCRHMTGDPREPGWQMCGNAVKAAYSYCEYHYGKVIDVVRTAQIRKAKRL